MRILGMNKIPFTAFIMSLFCSATFPAWLPSLPHEGPCTSSSISHWPSTISTRDGTHLHTTACAVPTSPPSARPSPVLLLQGAFLSSSGHTGPHVSPFLGLSPALDHLGVGHSHYFTISCAWQGLLRDTAKSCISSIFPILSLPSPSSYYRAAI